MRYATVLITKAKNELGMSQNQLAHHLGVTQSRISHINTGREPMPEYMAHELAELLGLNPLETLGRLRAEYAENDKVRNTWLKLVTGTAATLVISPMIVLSDCVQCILC